VTIKGASRHLFNVTGWRRPELYEVNEADRADPPDRDPNVNMIFGAVIDEAMGDSIRIHGHRHGLRPDPFGAACFGGERAAIPAVPPQQLQRRPSRSMRRPPTKTPTWKSGLPAPPPHRRRRR